MKGLRVGAVMLALVLGALGAGGVARGQALPGKCTVKAVAYQGWEAEEVKNQWVTLTFVPKLGGRLMQVEFEGHAYLFVNPKYRGKYVSPEEAKGGWINYGGDKIWPMPEGDQDEHHWVLASTALDDLPYAFKVLSEGSRCAVRLTGQVDRITGLQYERTISLAGDSPEIDFHAVMKNASAKPILWSVQSVSQYDLSDRENGSDYNHELWAYAPVSADSGYPDGYHVRAGLADDPSFSVADGMFRLHWMYFENEVWVDSRVGWLTVFDKAAGFGMVERFSYDARGEYPGKATVIFYKNGPSVSFDKEGRASLAVTTPALTPYYMEAEINSPIVPLAPGATYALDTMWNPVRMTEAPRAVTAGGVVGERLRVTREGSGATVTGRVAPFGKGALALVWVGADGGDLGHKTLREAGPGEGVVVQEAVTIPAGAAKARLVQVDARGGGGRVIDEAAIDGSAGPAR
jgi:hypothetical protein